MKKMLLALCMIISLATAAIAADFAAADVDQDGVVTLEEATAAGISEEEFTAADTNGDGVVTLGSEA